MKPETLPATAPSVAGSLLTLMLMVQQKLIRPSEQITRDSLSPLQFQALGTLSLQGSQTMRELAQILVISKQQLTPVVDRLERDGLVARKSDPADRRLVRLELSPAGSAYLLKMKEQFEAMVTSKIQPLDGQDQAALWAALDTVTGILAKLP
jgi:DNA-binding MarR family transcriptional regulator